MSDPQRRSERPNLALALLAVLGLWALVVSTDEREPEQAKPGAGIDVQLSLQSPTGRVEAFERFVWQTDMPPGWTAVVQVFAVGAQAPKPEPGSAPEPIDTSPVLETNNWTPSSERTAAWPPRIRWRVELRDGAQRVRKKASVNARRALK